MTQKFCETCDETFVNKTAFISHTKSRRHLKKLNLFNANSIECSKCKKRFLKSGYILHIRKCFQDENPESILHQENIFSCMVCNKLFNTLVKLNLHIKYMHRENKENTFSDMELTENVGTKEYPPQSVEGYIYKNKKTIIDVIKKGVNKFNFTKFNVVLDLTFRRINPVPSQITNTLNTDITSKWFSTFTRISSKPIIRKIINNMITEYENKLNELNPSDLVLHSFNFITITCIQINPFNIKSYIELPFISNYLINIKNKDNKCFLWSILADLYPALANPHRVSNYKNFENMLDTTGLEFPVNSKSQIYKFEQLNNLRINVFQLSGSGKEIYPYYISDQTMEKVISLLIISKEADNTIKHHFVLIKNFQKFVRTQFRRNNKGITCERCMTSCKTSSMYDKHKSLCNDNVPALIKMPDKNNSKLSFSNYSYLNKPLMTIYADIEAINVPTNLIQEYNKIFEKNPDLYERYIDFQYVKNYKEPKINKLNFFFDNIDDSYTITKTVQEASSYCLYLVSDYFPNDVILYRGKDVLVHFSRTINKIEHKCWKLLSKMNFSPSTAINEEINNFMNDDDDGSFSSDSENNNEINNEINNEMQSCWMCEKPITQEQIKVIDHNHFLEQNNIRGYAHRECNINCKRIERIPVIFHNLAGYDIHMFIKSLAKTLKNTFKPLCKTKEDYIMVEYGCLRFIDSLKFFSSSLESIANSLNDGDFNHLVLNMNKGLCEATGGTSEFKTGTKIFNEMRKKGIWPHEYMDSFERYEETKIPGIEYFYSEYLQEQPSLEEYKRVKYIYKTFKCKNLGDGSDLYLLQDVFLLADCFEKFRNLFKLEPSNFVSLPGLAWQTMLKETDTKLELITDIDIYLFIKNNIRGGISSIMGSRKITAWNPEILSQHFELKKGKLMPKNNIDVGQINQEYYYGELEQGLKLATEVPNDILYIDAYSLYPGTMTLPLPTGEFKYESISKINYFLDLDMDSEIGAFLEVDLEYPDSIKESTKDFPFMPISRSIDYEEYGDYQKEFFEKGKQPKNKKLVCDQNNKEHYFVHLQLLKFYLNHGIVLRKVHTIISFKQSRWLKPFVDTYIKKRQTAKENNESFGDTMYKRLLCSIFGKTLENVDQYRNIKLFTNTEAEIIKYIKTKSKPTFHSQTIFCDELVAVETLNYVKIYNKPIYIGAAILELSKLQMYSMKYDVLQPHFKDRMKMHYMDTDSMFLTIGRTSLYESVFKEIKNAESASAKAVLKKLNNSGEFFTFKDEYPKDIIWQVIFLKSKNYSIVTQSRLNQKKSKGIQKVVVEKNITHRNYNECLESKVSEYRNVMAFRNVKHEMFIIKSRKKALGAFDDKRFITADGIHTEPYGFRLETKPRDDDDEKNMDEDKFSIFD